MHVLVTGGAGYIGSHTCVALLQAGFEVTALDNYVNSHPVALVRVQAIAQKPLQAVKGDVRDRVLLARLFSENSFDAVIHFAGLKAVGDSVCDPLSYYDCNVGGTLALLQAMQAANVKKLVFSSSATVYGEPQFLPLTEDHPLRAENPYGQTKLVVENLLSDLVRSDTSWRVGVLRYFNPVGAHESGQIGEDPQGTPNNLMPYIAQVAVGRRESLPIFGKDYPTPDGTGVRDYLHVVDLAQGHVAALQRLTTVEGGFTVNLGTGAGVSVLQMVEAFSRVIGRPIPYQFSPRRPGDVASNYASPDSAQQLLAWRAERGLDAMCADTWRWQSQNPAGYAK